jgi:hypothetical protein
MAAAVQKTVIGGPNLEMVRAHPTDLELMRGHFSGLSSLAAHLLVSDITRAFSKENPPANPGLRAAFNSAAPGQTGLVLASNKRISNALETDEWKSIEPAFTLWTGTMTAYVEPDTPLIKSRMFSRNDNALVYDNPYTAERWLFLLSGVPAGCLDAPNVILVAEHPLYSLEKVKKGKDIIVTPDIGAVDALFDFPVKDGLYLGDSKHGIPLGPQIGSENLKARYLVRVQGAGRVGLVARYAYLHWGYGGYQDMKDFVGLNSDPHMGFGVAVEAP